MQVQAAAAGDEPGAMRVGVAERIIVLFGGMAAALTVMGLATVLPQIDAALAHSQAEHTMVKLLGSIAGLAMVLGAPLAGFMVERVGVRRFLLAMCAGYALLGTAGLWVDDLRVLLASRLLLGLFASAITTTAMIIVNSGMTGAVRAKWTGLHIAVATLCSLVLFPVLGQLGEASWRGPFAAYGVVGAALGGVALFTGDVGVGRGDAAGATAKTGLASWFPTGLALLALVLGGFAVMPAVYLSFLVKQAVAHSSSNTALVMMASSLTSAAASFAFGRAARALDWRVIFIVAFAFYGAGFATLAMAHSLAMIATGAVLSGVGIGWSMANLFSAAAQQSEPATQGRVTGVIKGAQYVAGPLGVVALEPVARAFGPQGAFGAGALVAGLMVVWFAALAARRKPRAI
ncbi:MAG: MFS transporter [Sphingomonadales bacterium]|nr:MFS transporter [Sphingomonadales bacterium]